MRLEVSTRTEHAIHALRYLATNGRSSGSTIAGAIGTSPAFLARVMTPLVRAAWIESKPGLSGGYSLSVPLTEISVLELIEAVEGPVDDGRCVLRTGPCDGATECSLHGAWSRARDALTTELRATTVA